MPTCPKCESTRVQRYTPHGLDCDNCGYSGRGDEFRLRKAMRWIADHSNDPGVVKRARDEMES